MPWVPTTDFEEEVINLQPHHDFIYGVLSEPEYNYPRPKAHIEYAVNKKAQSKEQKTCKMNGKLHIIQQVQRMASTKPVGEQPSLDDWENNKKIEQETIGMMRYCGMGVSVEQPLNQKVTIATYPVENTIKVVQSGRKKVALYFDEKVFKLKEKVTDTSSGFDSCNNSDSYELKKNRNEDFLTPELEGDSNTEACCNTSFSSNSSLSMNSFSTTGDNSDSFSSVTANKTSSSTRLKAERLRQYEKLFEDTALLSLNSSSNSHTQNCDSFETAEEVSFWKPISEDEENVFEKQEYWPVLSNQIGSTNKNKRKNKLNIKPSYSKDNLLNKTSQSDSTDDMSSDITTSSSNNNDNNSKRTNFLDRFTKTKDFDTLNTTDSTISASSSQEPTTYATIAKAPKPPAQSVPLKKGKVNSSYNMITDFQPFFTTRRMYALKRHAK